MKALESYGEGEQVPIPEGPDSNGIAQAVSRGLGLPAALSRSRTCLTGTRSSGDEADHHEQRQERLPRQLGL